MRKIATSPRPSAPTDCTLKKNDSRIQNNNFHYTHIHNKIYIKASLKLVSLQRQPVNTDWCFTPPPRHLHIHEFNFAALTPYFSCFAFICIFRNQPAQHQSSKLSRPSTDRKPTKRVSLQKKCKPYSPRPIPPAKHSSSSSSNSLFVISSLSSYLRSNRREASQLSFLSISLSMLPGVTWFRDSESTCKTKRSKTKTKNSQTWQRWKWSSGIFYAHGQFKMKIKKGLQF